MRDAFPSFGILGLLKGLVNRVRKPRDMSEYNKLSLTAPEDQKVYIPKGRDPSMIIDNPFKNQDFNYGITNNPLTQQLQTQNYFSGNNMPANNMVAFNPGTQLDRTLKNLYSGYENLGITDPNLIPLMQQDIQQNEEEGTPLSLPKTAYSMIG
tara:strand:- start:550 stop:1008 length:459 start_codon:yes stop_codon:yes gene_type:complete